jgi:hypothetical protein
MSPRSWVRYWVVGFVLGPALLVYGIAAGDAGLIFLGVATLFFTIGIVAFWRRQTRNAPPSSASERD